MKLLYRKLFFRPKTNETDYEVTIPCICNDLNVIGHTLNEIFLGLRERYFKISYCLLIIVISRPLLLSYTCIIIKESVRMYTDIHLNYIAYIHLNKFVYSQIVAYSVGG